MDHLLEHLKNHWNDYLTIIGVITAIFAVYLPLKFRKDDKTPNISISPFQERQNYFSVTNHGGDLLNMKIKISFLQEGKQENRDMPDFFNAEEDPTLGYPHKCNSLKTNETKKVIHCPMYSDNGEINVFIMGENIDGKKYNTSLILKNLIKK